MPFTPLNDRVVLQLLPREMISPGGIVIPECASMNTKSQRARVVSVGEGRRTATGRAPMSVSVGDVVVVGLYAGSAVTIDGQNCRIVLEHEILCIEGRHV